MARWAVMGSLALWAVLGCGVLQAAVVSGGVIDTTGPGIWDGVANFSPFGEGTGATATYGQTFKVPTPYTVLESFTIHVDDDAGPEPLTFKAYIAGWNEDAHKLTGDLFFESGELSTTNNHGNGNFESITVNANHTLLASDTPYVAFFSVSECYEEPFITAKWGRTSEDVYDNGYYVYQNNWDNFDWLSNYGWNLTYDDLDLAFQMVFSDPNAPAVPEPASLAVWSVLGGVGIAVARWQKRKAKA